MDNSFGGMSEEEFFLGWDAMIDEDDPDSINYDPWEHDYHSLDYEEKNYIASFYINLDDLIERFGEIEWDKKLCNYL